LALLVVAVAFGCKGGGGGGSGKAKGKYRDVVAKCFKLMAVDLDAVKDKHTALAGWQAPAAGSKGIQYASKAGSITVKVVEPGAKGAQHVFARLGLAVSVEVSGEEKFVRAVKDIVAGRLVPLRDLNAAVDKSLKGIVADLSAEKSKHAELAQFGAGALKGDKLEYASDGFSLAVWVELLPASTRTQRAFPVHAKVQGARPTGKAVLAIIDKNMEPLKELERRTGGWRTK
jgi:hypothetical protein